MCSSDLALLGRGDGGAVYRLVAADEGQDEHGVGDGWSGGLRAGGDVDPDAWAHGHVGDFGGGTIQLDYVSEYFYCGADWAWTADFEGIELDGGGDCGWRITSAG